MNIVVGAAAAVASSPLAAVGTGTMRRSSLSSLKIPARISQAHVGLRRDLSMGMLFSMPFYRRGANESPTELKELQGMYQTLASEVQGILDMHVLHPSKEEKDPACTSLRQSQQAYKQLASAFYTINSKYRISWECTELLIELGGGQSEGLKSKRGQAIALQDAAKVPPNVAAAGTVPIAETVAPPAKKAKTQCKLLEDFGGHFDELASNLLESEVYKLADQPCLCGRSGVIATTQCYNCTGYEMSCRACFVDAHMQNLFLGLKSGTRCRDSLFGMTFRSLVTSSSLVISPSPCGAGLFTVVDNNGIHSTRLSFFGCNELPDLI
ncbi:hypothetical protein B0H14DRAFT_2569282 [Mycena olivaceomarginata]|nr:hypothetical protein B0H14DRAFT_2569282 [Mycena olivaceomarginata]